jgi:hypothetical protein
VTAASGVGEAQDKVAAQRFHLALVDLGLPDGDGCATSRPRGRIFDKVLHATILRVHEFLRRSTLRFAEIEMPGPRPNLKTVLMIAGKLPLSFVARRGHCHHSIIPSNATVMVSDTAMFRCASHNKRPKREA